MICELLFRGEKSGRAGQRSARWSGATIYTGHLRDANSVIHNVYRTEMIVLLLWAETLQWYKMIYWTFNGRKTLTGCIAPSVKKEVM